MNAGDLAQADLDKLETQEQEIAALKRFLEAAVGPIEFLLDGASGIIYACPSESGVFGRGGDTLEALQDLEAELKAHRSKPI